MRSEEHVSTAPAEGAPPLLAGRYRLEEVVGRGGMADVYRAVDVLLDRPVAIKLLRAVGSDELERDRAEVRLLAALNHPGLVCLYDAGTDENGCAFLVLEYVDGGTLAARLRSQGPLELTTVARLGADMADALSHVHAQGVVHRDVKPGNVLLDRTGRPRLADFGIARLVDATRMTATGLTVGTAAYLAPEQVAGESVTSAADVYSLGLVLIECITGVPAYEGSSIESALARLHRAPVLPDELPADWAALLEQMTDREPTTRPTTAEAAVWLHRLAAGGIETAVVATPPLAARTPEETGPAATQQLRLPVPPPEVDGPSEVLPSRRPHSTLGRNLVLGAVGAAVLLVGLLVVAAQNGDEPGPAPSGNLPAAVEEDLRELEEAVQP